MQRRFALAAALAFTIVVTAGVLALGSAASWFGGGKKPASAQPAVASAQPAQSAPQAPAPAEAPPDPIYRTEYVYLDQPAANGARASAPRPAVPAPQDQTAAQGAAPTVVATAPAAPSATPAPQPTSPPAPTAPAPHPPTATPPPPPTQAPPPPSGQGQPHELEFTGTVTAINGNVVTFSHGGTSTDVTVNQGLGSLSIGTRAHVHAILNGGHYVADEIDTGD